ncbi:MAG: prepilin-type N-terminal cleavage/methylation domain-containing protein [Candidatus Pacebacteria bacterium]|nr:prepilin-type N-terminal cleavage/methylation domain-containing protein [Candidatus Paceibacterota bacterium]
MNNKSFTLIEVLLSVFILTVAVLGLYNGINYSYNSVKKAKDKFMAAYLAEEGVELVKNLRDTNFVSRTEPWSTGLTNCPITAPCKIDITDTALDSTSPYALLKNDNGIYSYDSGVDTIFSRQITTIESGDKIKVIVTVTYGNEEFELQQYLYNWF